MSRFKTRKKAIYAGPHFFLKEKKCIITGRKMQETSGILANIFFLC